MHAEALLPIPCSSLLTCPLCVHIIDGGGSGKWCTTQVKLTVEPPSMYKSGPPRIVVIGSMEENKNKMRKYKKEKEAKKVKTWAL